MTLDDIRSLLRDGRCNHITLFPCEACATAAIRTVEAWHARAELVRDLDDDAVQFVRDSGQRLRAERDAAVAAREESVQSVVRAYVAQMSTAAALAEMRDGIEALLSAIEGEFVSRAEPSPHVRRLIAEWRASR